MSTSRVWLISGCSTGIGRVLAEAALQADQRVIATARKPESLADLASRFGKNVLTLKLDVNEPADIKAVLNAAQVRFGGVDVLVNNAGYGLEGAIEETPLAQARAQFDTNFFGLLALTQAVLPGMRAQGSGYIVNVASVAGLRGFGGLGLYCASKFAVVGLSEALAQEVKAFGIRVSVVEPGPYRTDWAGRSLVRTPSAEALATGISTGTPAEGTSATSAYTQLNTAVRHMLDTNNGRQPGDPQHIAQVLLAAAAMERPPMHLLFGDEAIQAWEGELTKLADPAFFARFPHGKTSF